MDLKEQQISDSSSSPSSQTKSCRDCRTTKTPLWRGGPSGPKSLCNACGIKYNKKRRALLGLNAGNKDKKKIGGLKQPQKNSSGSNGSSISSGEVGRSLKLRLVTMGGRGDMVFQQRSSSAAAVANQKQKEQQMRSKKKFGEEEQAAILLMALSCGSFY